MLNPHTLKPGALFWICADITGNGEVWQRAMLRESEEGSMIRYLDSDSGEFEDYWDPTDEDPANFRLDAPEPPNTPDVRVLRQQIARLKNQIRAMKQAGMNTNAAFCEWAPPEVRAPYFAAWDAAVADVEIPTAVEVGGKRAYLTSAGKSVVRSALANASGEPCPSPANKSLKNHE